MWILFAVLVILHHDWWFWNDGRLLWGFMPIGLAYQGLISVAAAALVGWAAFCQPGRRSSGRGFRPHAGATSMNVATN